MKSLPDLADDDEGILLPKTVTDGKIIKVKWMKKATSVTTSSSPTKGALKLLSKGLSHKFDKEYWNYAKLISGVLRYGMPIDQVIKLVSGLQLDNESINTWKVGVERALKKYIPDGTQVSGQECPGCNEKTLVYQEGCLTCKNCGYSKCG
jgi:ribonucleoside-diphosphate reductase alpha chain